LQVYFYWVILRLRQWIERVSRIVSTQVVHKNFLSFQFLFWIQFFEFSISLWQIFPHFLTSLSLLSFYILLNSRFYQIHLWRWLFKRRIRSCVTFLSFNRHRNRAHYFLNIVSKTFFPIHFLITLLLFSWLIFQVSESFFLQNKLPTFATSRYSRLPISAFWC
jgi:hypothetical protein